jgi:hypothetical protein
MKGTLFSTSASWIAAAFFGHTQGGLNKGFNLSEALQRLFSAFICHEGACHVNKYIYFPYNVNKKIPIAKKYFLFQELGSKKVGTKGLIIANNFHSLFLDERPHLLLVFGNPASHSVKAGCFFAFKDGKENPFWKSLLCHAGILDFGLENEIEDVGANRRRLNRMLTGDYRSPFCFGLCVFISMPSRAGGEWSGVAGIRRLLGKRAWERVAEIESDRIINIARSFIKGDRVVVTFQRDAWENLRSKSDPPYAVIKAREGNLKGSLNSSEGIRLIGAPPTRLLGPARKILRRMLSEEGYELLPKCDH